MGIETQEHIMKKAFRVLCIDGGGMRGLYTATLLSTLAYRFDSRFSKESPDIGKVFNLVCGTSTGAILACGLAAGIPISKIQSLYIDKGATIFVDPMPSEQRRVKLFGWACKYITKPSANASKLKDALIETFGSMTIKELYEKRGISLCIPSINASNYKAWVFKTPHILGKHRDDNYTLVDVCMASSAAPIILPVAQLSNPDNKDLLDNFVDGGLWANNPSLIGLIEALGIIDFSQYKLDVLSVGTCDRPSGDPYSIKNPKWGLWRWRGGMNIVEMSLSSQSFGYTHATRFLNTALNKLGVESRFVRLEQTNKSPEQYSAINIDRADKVAIQTLSELARTDADAIHSKVLGNAPGDLEMVKDVFSSLQVIS